MKPIYTIKDKINHTPASELPRALAEYEDDSRIGVQKLVQSGRKRYEAYLREQNRLWEINAFEREGYSMGATLIGGADEVGRGPLAGPVVTAVVVLPKDCVIEGVNDSKKLSPKKRDELFEVIKAEAIDYAIGVVSAEEIDEINILQATKKAMAMAFYNLKQKPDYLLVDALTIPGIDVKQKSIIKGDEKSISIGAASIVAKVTRDQMMEEYAKLYPGYDFENNKGYGAPLHIEGIQAKGICPIHRRSFVKNFLTGDVSGKELNKVQGDYGEKLAAKMLIKHGCEIMERNYRTKIGEIDIIARKEDCIIFAEVKFRSDIAKGRPAEAVNYYKQKKIIKVAKEYIVKNGLTGKDFRFDVIEVLNGNPPMGRIIENAFGE